MRISTIGALLLVAVAAWAGWTFRALPPAVDLRAMTWDAASHALIGLDVFDSIRRLEPLPLLLRLQEEHWWPPLFGVLSLPAYVFGGRHLSSPSLVSFASYCLIPVLAWLTIRRVTRSAALLAWGLVAILFLRSPTLLEMSAWSMLEPVAGLFALASFYFFFAPRQSRGRNWAYGFAGASTLLKYHYGFFLLVTLGAATIWELEPEQRASLVDAITRRLRRTSTWLPLLLLVAAIAIRRIAETGNPHPAFPSVPNIVWFAYIIAIVVAVKGALWSTLPDTVRRFVKYGMAWPLVWCVDPANVHAWYRELGVVTEPPARLTEQFASIPFYLLRDYILGPVIFGAVLLGFVLSVVEAIRRRHSGLLALTLHAIWPAIAMSLSPYRLESRFLSTLVLCLFTSAAIGWTTLLARHHAAIQVAVLALLVADQATRNLDWQRELVTRRVYCYASSDPPDRFVRETVDAFRGGEAVLILLPPDIQVVAPTIRLGLRLARPDIRPDLIDVEGGGTALLSKRLNRFDGGLIGIESDSESLRRLVEAKGLRIVSEAAGPPIPSTSIRALRIVRVKKGSGL